MDQPKELEVPPLLQTLLELIGNQFQLTEGRATLEVRFQDGSYAGAFRHEGPIGPAALKRVKASPSR